MVDQSTYFFVLFLFLVDFLLFLAAVFFFGADFFAAVFLFFGAGFLAVVFFFYKTYFFLGAELSLGAAAFFSEAMRIFLNSDDSLYEFLICIKSPEAMPAFNPDSKVAFNHFLSFGRSSCMIFFISIMDNPFLSLSLSISLMIPDLYNIFSVCSFSQSRRELQVDWKYHKPYGASKTDYSS